ncbi:MAG TPA: TfpX/TfpZ family type IV pilin accessory protein [Burkholderiales bacterium]|nr:TfpX/TfpZ family type IV pilin accessory protein [Burkholderiales bacterium]
MEKKKVTRWRASGLHLLISIAVAVGVLALMLSLWYPGPLFEAAGGNDLLFILVGVDVVVGPLITLVIFRSGKRGLKFDLGVIAALQIGALIYGMHAVYLARPAFIVFVADQFQVASAAQLDPEELAKAKYPEFRQPPLGGPMLAFAVVPTDPVEFRQFVILGAAGHDLQEFPRLFVPYAERTAQVLARSLTLTRVRQLEPQTAKIVDAWLAQSGTREADVRYVPLRGRTAWIAVLIDAKTAQPVKMLITDAPMK